jgi:hypothetical protein
MDGGAVSQTKLIAVRERCDLCVDTTTITEAVSQDDSPQFSAALDDASFVPLPESPHSSFRSVTFAVMV